MLALMSATSHSNSCSSTGCVATIKTIYTKLDGMVYLGTPADELEANCAPHSDVYFVLNPNAANFEAAYSSVLSAYISGRKIQLRIQEGSNPCEISYVRFDSSY